MSETTDRIEWIYSPEEWKAFLRWQGRKKAGWFYWLSVRRWKKQRVPQVGLTTDIVFMDNEPIYIDTAGNSLRRIMLRDAGDLNVLVLIYGPAADNRSPLQELYLPVPRGRLREAIQFQEGLTRW